MVENNEQGGEVLKQSQKSYDKKRKEAKDLIVQLEQKIADLDKANPELSVLDLKSVKSALEDHFTTFPDAAALEEKKLNAAHNTIKDIIKNAKAKLKSAATSAPVPKEEEKESESEELDPKERVRLYQKVEANAKMLKEQLEELTEKTGNSAEDQKNIEQVRKILTEVEEHFSRWPSEAIEAKADIAAMKDELDTAVKKLKELNLRMFAGILNIKNPDFGTKSEPAKEPEPILEPPKSAESTEIPKSKVEEKPVETPKKEAEKKKGIIDVSAADLKEIIGEKHVREIREVKVLLAQSGNEIQAREMLETLFDKVDKTILEEKMKASGYGFGEFIQKWKEEWSGTLIEIFKGDVDLQRAKVLEQQQKGVKGTLEKWGDWFDANISAARAKQIFARVGSVAGVATAVAYAAPAVGFASAAAVAGGTAAGVATWTQKRWKKASEWLKKTDAAAAERTHEKQEENREYRLHSERVSKALEARLEKESEVELFGMLSGVLRETSFGVASTVPVEEGRKKMEFANQALLQQKCYERMVTEMEHAGAEEKDITGKRMDAVIMGLYADESKRFSQVLASAVEREPALMNVVRRISAFKNVDFDGVLGKKSGHGHDDGHGKKGHKEDHGKDHGKGHGKSHGGDHGHGHGGNNYEKLTKAFDFAIHAAGGATIALAIQAEPGLFKAITGAIAGGYVGMKIGVGREQKAREKNFEKNITAIITNAEHVIDHAGDGMKLEDTNPGTDIYGYKYEQNKKPLTKEKSIEYRKWAQEIRMALNFGLIKKDTTMWYRAHTVLRGIESRVYELSLPDTKMRNLLSGLEADLEAQKHEQDEKIVEFGKVGKAPMLIGGAVGLVAGGVLGYLWGSARAHNQGTPQSQHHTHAENGAGIGAVAVNQEDSLHGTAQFEHAASPVHEPSGNGSASTAVSENISRDTLTARPDSVVHSTDTAEKVMDTHSITEVIQKGEGVLSGANRAVEKALHEHSIPGLQSMDAGKLHAWKIKELENMGFIFRDGKWGYPFTVHPGAEVVLYTDPEGNPHFKMASEEHVTKNEFYKFKEAGVADAHVSPGLEKEITGARANVQKFVGEINASTEMNATTHPSIIIDKDLSAEIRVGGQIPGVLHAETAYDGTAVKLTLEGGKTAYAYPAQGAELKFGTDSNTDKFYWKIQTVEHSPIFQLPDEVVVSKAGGMTDSDMKVDEKKFESAFVHRNESDHIKTGDIVGENPKILKSVEPEIKKDAVNSSKNIVKSVPEKNIDSNIELNVNKFDTALKTVEHGLKERVNAVVNLSPARKAQTLSMLDEWLNEERLSIHAPGAEKSLNITRYADELGAHLSGKEAEIALFTEGFSDKTPIFTDAEYHISGRAIVGKVDYTIDNDAISYIRFQPTGSTAEYVYMAPPGYHFEMEDTHVVMKGIDGKTVPYGFSEENFAVAKVIPVTIEDKNTPTQTTRR